MIKNRRRNAFLLGLEDHFSVICCYSGILDMHHCRVACCLGLGLFISQFKLQAYNTV